MDYDLFGEILSACRDNGIKCSAYLNVGLSHEEGLRHRDWLSVNPEGSIYGADRMNNFFRRMCYNSPYAEHFLAMLQELLSKYQPDGFFFDCTTVNPCIGIECIGEMKEKGVDWQDEKAVFEFARTSLLRFCRRISELALGTNPNLLVYFNGIEFRRQQNLGTYLEYEALGRSIYEGLPITAHYARNFNKPVLNMIGRFHQSWADFGGICTPEVLEYYLAYGLANTMRCTVGDHFHPRGDIQKPVFRLIQQVYQKLQRFSACYPEARAVSEFVLLTPEKTFDYTTCDAQSALFALYGAARMFDQMHLQYEVMTPDMDFSACKVLILPDETRIDSELAGRIRLFLDQGGKVFCSGQGGLAIDRDELLLPLGAQCLGKSSCHPAYIKINPELCPDFPEMPVTLYQSGMAYQATEGGVSLASIIKPMVEYGWDGEHGNFYTPPDAENGDAAILESAAGILFSHPLFQTYRVNGQPCFLSLTRALLQRLLPEPLLQLPGLPSYGRAMLTRQGKRLHLHLMNFHPESPSPEQVLVPPPAELRKLTIRVRLDKKKIHRIYLADTGETLQWKIVGNYVECKLESLKGYQVISLDFG